MHSRSCWWSASESHRSGNLLARQIRVPSPHSKLVVGYANDSSGSHSLAAFAGNFTVGTAGWTRTTFSPLKRRDSSPLSYDGMGWCSVLESNQAGRFGREGYSLAGVRPRLTLRVGTRCRLSACDFRFVGPTLFTSELTGHRLATTSGNDPLSPSRQLGCDTCRISGQNWLPTCGSNAARPD